MDHILVVDDRPENLKLMRKLLEDQGWQVEVACDGAEALVKARLAPPALVISDLLMPVMDGYTLLRHWKADPRLQPIPFVVYTGTYTDPRDERLAIEMGVDAFLLKAAEPAGVMARVRGVMDRAKAGAIGTPQSPSSEDATVLRKYNETLVRKLEDQAREAAETNRQLVAREAHLRAILENEPECVKLLGANGALLEMNPAGLRMLEADSLAEVQNRSVYQLIAPDCRDAFRDLTTRVMRGESGTLEFEIIGLKGTHRWLETHATPLRDERGQPVALLGITRDITERRQAGVALALSEERLRLAVDGADLGTWHWDLGTNELVWSDRCLAMFGIPPGTVMSYGRFLAALHPADGPVVDTAVQHALRSQTGYDLEFRTVWPDGTIHWTAARGRTYADDAGRPLRMEGILLDVTEGKRSEALLQGQKDALELIASGAPLTESLAALLRAVEAEAPDMLCSILLLDPDGLHVRHGAAPSLPDSFNQRFDGAAIGPRAGCCGTAAYRGEPVVSADIATDPLWADYRDIALAHGLRACWSTPVFNAEHRVLGTFAMYFRHPMRPTDRHQRLVAMVTHLAAVAIDKRREETAVRVSERRLHQILDGLGPHMFVGLLDPEGVLLLANRSSLEAASLREEEVLGKPFDQTYWWSHDEVVSRRLRAAIRGASGGEPVRYDEQVRIGEGRLMWVDFSLQPLRDESGQVAFLIPSAEVITERKQAEDALRSSEERFRQLAETIREVFWMTDPEKNQMLYVSPAYEAIWGRTCESLRRSPRTWLESIAAEDRDRVTQAALAMQASGGYDEVYRITRPDGTMRWIHDRAFPVRDEAGKVFRIAGVAEDITEAKAVEEQLRQSQKLEAIGLLAGGVAHDFNNILTAIMMQAEMAGSSGGITEDARTFVDDIKVSAERAARLTQQLLAFSRRQVMQPRALDLNEAVSSMAKMLRRILGEDVRLQLRLARSPLTIQADAGMLDQVLMNLAVNARDAMPAGGRLTIETGGKEITAADARLLPDVAPGRYAWVRVSDTGCGIPPELREHVFEPFFTTKDPGKGTGLGLATVFGIIKQHRGAIALESEAGCGTTFQIYLPASQVLPAAAAVELAQARSLGGTETILLAEDDAAVRRITRFVLERQGYHVLEAAHGPDALDVWEGHAGPIQLLLTDLVMPEGMSGKDLAARLERRDPTLKVIFTSGYSVEVAGRELKLKEGQNFIQKPCPVVELLATIRRSLDGGRDG